MKLLQEYALPVAISATLAVGGTIGINHSERITSLETETRTGFEVQKDMLKELKESREILIRLETKLEERVPR